MTTNVDHLALVAQTINTQYDLARIELFRPLEVYDRWNGIKASELGCGCKPSFSSVGIGAWAGDPEHWETLKRRLAPMRDAMQEIALVHDTKPSIDVYQNTARCSCVLPTSGDRKAIVRYSARISILWNGRTLMREYALPEVAK